jgi:hypothetical protein
MNRRLVPVARVTQTARIVVFLLPCVAIVATLAFCERQNEVNPSKAQQPADKVYTVRGRITMLPVPGKPTTDLAIHHEAINDFENASSPRGMASMDMTFPPAPGVSLDGLAVGDIVEFDLSVWYKPGTKSVEGYRVTRIKRLPADTKLEFGPATPTLGPPPGG